MLESRPLEDLAEIQRSQRQRRIRSARGVLATSVWLTLGVALFSLVIPPPNVSKFLSALALAAAVLMSYVMLRRHLRQWPVPLVVGALVFIAWEIYSDGSVRSASTLGLLGAVVLAGTYLSQRDLWATTGFGVLILGLLSWAESGGHLVKPGLAPDLRFWLIGSGVMGVIGTLLHHTRKATDEAHLRQLNQMEERFRLEHERDRSQRRFKRIFRLNPTALVIQFAGTRTVQEANPACERGFGYPAGQLVGQPAACLWADEPEWQAHCRQLFEQGRTGWQHAQWRHADGRSIEVMVSSELSEDPGGLLILTTALHVPDEGADISDGYGAPS